MTMTVASPYVGTASAPLMKAAMTGTESMETAAQITVSLLVVETASAGLVLRPVMMGTMTTPTTAPMNVSPPAVVMV